MPLSTVRPAIPAGLAGLTALALACAACQTAHRPAIAPIPRAGAVVAGPTCVGFTVSVYFEPGSAALGPIAETLLDAAAARAHRCYVTGVRVRGLADAPGAHETNLVLSRARATSVSRALRRRGFTQVEFQVSAEGDLGAAGSPADASHPLRRRVELEIDLARK